MKYRICFIGAGNLATHLSKVLHENGYKIVQIYSRTELAAQTLANKFGADCTASVHEVTHDVDLYFVALKDSAVNEVLSHIGFQNKLIVHCSGSLPLSVLEHHSENIGVLYPLQTFSKNRKVDFNSIPIFIEANSQVNKDLLLNVGKMISQKVSELDSVKRKALHISAVFACNFVNHMYTLSAEFLNSKDMQFEVLKPLIEETAKKVQELNPAAAQTGPAVRFDKNIIDDHIKQLEKFPQYQELYNSISKSIFEHHKEKNK